ncbi:glutathione S-transferase family protein [Sphingomonas dokdonensis]|uniref:Glutathione S-transferase GST-6.0 n=1 Tax=Sphingomonas dokdonensis TaxID=344880 RepID=A0A245ZMM9_9SPHN|nr:glutathione S-transferase [Sphingomonas dokdonensis]OWK30999.1 glutathione S-transferase GST-6.0 [Sphingomonas dokdonensis]
MRFYNSVGPNPRVVTLFMAEKGIAIPAVMVDLRGAENRRAPYNVAINPAGQTPALEQDDGAILTEILPICEYLDELHPAPPLIGTTPEERATTRMWARRVDLKICEPLTSGFRYSEGLALFEPRMRCLPEAAAGLKAVAQDGMRWVDAQIAGRTWLTGERFTLADIHLFAFLDFGRSVGQPIDPACTNLIAWFDRVAARPACQPTA